MTISPAVRAKYAEKMMLDERLRSAACKIADAHGLRLYQLAQKWTGMPISWSRFSRSLFNDAPMDVFRSTVSTVEGFAETGALGQIDDPIVLADLADSGIDISETHLDESFVWAVTDAFDDVFGDTDHPVEPYLGIDFFENDAASIAHGNFGRFQPRVVQLSEDPVIVTIELWTDYGNTLLGRVEDINLEEVELPTDAILEEAEAMRPFIRRLFEENKGAV